MRSETFLNQLLLALNYKETRAMAELHREAVKAKNGEVAMLIRSYREQGEAICETEPSIVALNILTAELLWRCGFQDKARKYFLDVTATVESGFLNPELARKVTNGVGYLYLALCTGN